MDAHWTVYALIFVAVFLAAQGLLGIIKARSEARQIADRFGAIDGFRQNRDEVEFLKKRGSQIGGSGLLGWFQTLLVQSGTSLDVPKLGAVFLVLTVVLFIYTRRLGNLPGGAVAGLISALLLIGFLKRKRAKRIAKFGEQLPDVIEVIVRSLSAGHPLPVSLSLVGREMPGPAGPEFAVVFDEISYGREVRDALENLYTRVGHADLKFLITSIAIAHQTGGNLGEILGRLSKLLRERFRMRRKIKAISAEGRAGGLLMSFIPLVILGAVSLLQPGYYGEFWGHPTQNTAFGIACVLLVIGNFTIYKLVNFKV